MYDYENNYKIRVIERKYVVQLVSGTTRLLQNNTKYSNNNRILQAPISTIIYLQIMATPESSIYPSPTSMAISLNSREAQLNARLSNIDTTYTINAVDYVSYVPGFVGVPQIINITINWVTFSVQLNNYGWVFAVCVEASMDLGKPTAFQIYKGFNGSNVAMPSNVIEISQPYQSFTLNISSLVPNTEYNAYLVGGSAQPGYPDLMPDNLVNSLSFQTQIAPISNNFFNFGELIYFSSSS